MVSFAVGMVRFRVGISRSGVSRVTVSGLRFIV